MNLINLKDFEDELYLNLKKLEIDDPSGCLKYITRLIKTYKNHDNLENIFRDKLEFLLEKKTDEVIDIICNFFNIKRTYGFSATPAGINNDFHETNGNENRENDMHIQFTNKCQQHYLNSKKLHGIKKQSVKHSRLRRSISRVKWNDIAGSVQSTNIGRRLNMPCSTFLEKGFCMAGDTCKFTHGKAILVKPRKVLLNSIYNTNASATDCSRYILSNHSDSREKRAKSDAISVSSSGESEPEYITHSPPRIYTPPSILDSPLWYKELGLVVEVTDSDSSNDDRKRKKKNCVLVNNIPEELNRIGVLNKHFRKFGTLRNVQVRFNDDPTSALVEFRLRRDAEKANNSVEAIMGNRFIKTRIYKEHKLKSADKRHKVKRCRRTSRSSSRKYRVAKKHKENKKRSKHKRKYRDESADTSEYVERRRDSRSSSLQSRSSREKYRERSLEIVEREPSAEKEADTAVVKEERVVATLQEHEVPGTTAVVMETDEPVEPPRLVTENGLGLAAIMPPDNNADPKLENALNDSDVESDVSVGSVSRVKRTVIVGMRRERLRKENSKNSARQRVQRIEESMTHYKALLAGLIADFRSADKLKKAILVPQIKDLHARFMELKALRQATRGRNAEDATVEGEIGRLQSSIAAQLSVTTHEQPTAPGSGATAVYLRVPSTVVLYPEQIQASIGTDLVVNSFEMAACSDCDVLYVLTMDCHASACKAMQKLVDSAAGAWTVSMDTPEI